jgi:hypothetical protein
MADSKSDYEVGAGRRPLHTRLKEGQSDNPGGRRRPSAFWGADAVKPEYLFSADAIGRTCPRRQRTVAGPQNQTRRAVRDLLRLG